MPILAIAILLYFILPKKAIELGVENIIVAADISLKRKNIRMNLEAWLKSPNLGMMAMLTAGDKHFFRYAEEMKKQIAMLAAYNWLFH